MAQLLADSSVFSDYTVDRETSAVTLEYDKHHLTDQRKHSVQAGIPKDTMTFDKPGLHEQILGYKAAGHRTPVMSEAFRELTVRSISNIVELSQNIATLNARGVSAPFMEGALERACKKVDNAAQLIGMASKMEKVHPIITAAIDRKNKAEALAAEVVAAKSHAGPSKALTKKAKSGPHMT